VTFEKYFTKTGDASTISDHSCQNSNKIQTMAGTSKYKFFWKSPTPPRKIKFWRKKTSCFSKFEQCSNCGQNGVLSSYKMYLKYLDYVCSVNGGLNIRVLSVGVACPEIFLIN